MTEPGAGDEAAFAAYVRGRQAHLVWLAEVLAPGCDAEDLVQTALVRLAARWSRVEDPDAWLRRVLGNLVVDAIRHRARHPAVPLDVDVTAPGSFEDSHADSARLADALAALPASQRKAVVLRYLADLSEAETAARLDISVGSVKSASSRGLGRLRVLLHEEES